MDQFYFYTYFYKGLEASLSPDFSLAAR
jgi:hypothetical protein